MVFNLWKQITVKLLREFLKNICPGPSPLPQWVAQAGGLGAGLGGGLCSREEDRVPGKAEAIDPCSAESFTLNLQLLFWEGHLLTITGLKWVQFSKWFL